MRELEKGNHLKHLHSNGTSHFKLTNSHDCFPASISETFCLIYLQTKLTGSRRLRCQTPEQRRSSRCGRPEPSKRPSESTSGSRRSCRSETAEQRLGGGGRRSEQAAAQAQTGRGTTEEAGRRGGGRRPEGGAEEGRRSACCGSEEAGSASCGGSEETWLRGVE